MPESPQDVSLPRSADERLVTATRVTMEGLAAVLDRFCLLMPRRRVGFVSSRVSEQRVDCWLRRRASRDAQGEA